MPYVCARNKVCRIYVYFFGVCKIKNSKVLCKNTFWTILLFLIFLSFQFAETVAWKEYASIRILSLPKRLWLKLKRFGSNSDIHLFIDIQKYFMKKTMKQVAYWWCSYYYYCCCRSRMTEYFKNINNFDFCLMVFCKNNILTL